MTGIQALNADFRDMVAALHDANAAFLIVGAYAVSLHGHARTTGDMTSGSAQRTTTQHA
ncbi:MAG: hypothetical protein ACE37K_19715 [Planctomycetota bacterium]